jgi:hypothetical protein
MAKSSAERMIRKLEQVPETGICFGRSRLERGWLRIICSYKDYALKLDLAYRGFFAANEPATPDIWTFLRGFQGWPVFTKNNVR